MNKLPEGCNQVSAHLEPIVTIVGQWTPYENDPEANKLEEAVDNAASLTRTVGQTGVTETYLDMPGGDLTNAFSFTVTLADGTSREVAALMLDCIQVDTHASGMRLVSD